MGDDGRNWNLHTSKWCSSDTLENNLAVSQKVKQRATKPAIPQLGIYPRERKTCAHEILYMNFIAALFIIAKK